MVPEKIEPINNPNNSLVPRSDVRQQALQIPYIEIEKTDSNIYGDEIHLREYLHRVLRHKWIVVSITLIFTTIAAYFIFTQPSVYQATAQIQVDTENEIRLSDSAGKSSPFEERAYFNTQLELLENPELIRSVIKKYELDTNKVFLDKKFVDNKSVIEQLKTNDFSGKSNDKLADLPKSEYIEKNLDAERLQPFVEAVQKGLGVQPVLQNKQAIKDTRLIAIKFKHPNPQVCVIVSNALADELVSSNLDNKLQTNLGERNYLVDNIANLKAQIRKGENRLLEYGRNYQLPTQDDKQNTVVERLVGLNRQLLEAENDRKQAEAAYKTGTNPDVANILAENDVKQIDDIESKLDDLRQKRAKLLVEVTEKYPEVQEIDKQIAVLQKAGTSRREQAGSSYKTKLETRYKQALAREEAIRKSYDEQWEKTLNQNGGAINYRIIQQELETNRKMLGEMQQREKESGMLKAKTPNNIRVVDYALTPTEPLDQKRLPYLGLAFLFSFSLGIGGALLRDYFDDSVSSSDEVEKTLSLPAIAAIPQMNGSIFAHRRGLKNANPLALAKSKETKAKSNRAGSELIMNSEGYSPIAEAFHQLRTVLLLSPDVQNVKKLLITSGRQGEGKTTSAINIASSLANTGARVVLIDADMRSPRLHNIFELSNEIGLSNLLSREVKQEEILTEALQEVEGLTIVTAGETPFDCSESLGSTRMHELLESLEAEFDYVIIDSPPVSIFADSAVLASIVDGVLLIVQENRNSQEALRHTRKLLSMVGAKIVGVVLNKVKANSESYGYGYKYQN